RNQARSSRHGIDAGRSLHKAAQLREEASGGREGNRDHQRLQSISVNIGNRNIGEESSGLFVGDLKRTPRAGDGRRIIRADDRYGDSVGGAVGSGAYHGDTRVDSYYPAGIILHLI